MKILKCAAILTLCISGIVYGGYYSPQTIMVDTTNEFGVCVLQVVASRDENIAFSPYGLVSVALVLYEGARGPTAAEIHNTLRLPWDREVTRLGFRDMHRYLKSYFSNDGFLRGLVLSKPNVVIHKNYSDLLEFYGFDVNTGMTTVKPDVTTETPNMTAVITTTVSTTKAQDTTTVKTTAETTPLTTSTTTVSPDSEVENITIPTTKIEPTQPEPTSMVMLTDEKPDMPEIMSQVNLTYLTTTPQQPESKEMEMDMGKPQESTTEVAQTSKKEMTEAETVEVTVLKTTMSKTITSSVPNTTPMSETTKEEMDMKTAETKMMEVPLVTPPTVTEVPSTDAPVPSTDAPIPSTEAPPKPTEVPVPSTDAPIPSTEAPPKPTEVSVPSTQALIQTTEAPVPPTEPVQTTEAKMKEEEPSTTPMPILSTEAPAQMKEEQPEVTTPTLATDAPATPAPKEEEPISTLPTTAEQDKSEATMTTSMNPTVPSTNPPSTSVTTKVTMTETPLDTTEQTTTLETTEQTTTTQHDEAPNRKKRSSRSLDSSHLAAEHRDGVSNWVPHYQDPRWNYHSQNELWFFTYNGGENVPVLTYTAYLPFAYVSQLNALALQLPLDDPRYSIVIILPEERLGLSQVLYELQWCPIRAIMSQMKTTAVYAVVPSFTIVKHVNLGPALSQLGIRSLFDPFKSDLSTMSPETHVFVRTIEQVVTVSLRKYYANHRWFDATPSDVQQHFIVNHPFAYFVLDKETEVALMIGTIVNPIAHNQAS